MKRGARGFTLVEVLIVVAVLGIIAAIAAANFFQVWQRGRQKRTMADIRTISLALSAYAADFSMIPLGGGGTVGGIRAYLEPTYCRSVPIADAWRGPLLYEAAGMEYTLRSRGADSQDDVVLTFGPTNRYEADIIFTNGSFVQWPEGQQR